MAKILIVGLGNPGERYSKVRHNLGFMVVDHFVKKMDDRRWKIGVEDGKWKIEEKFKAEILRMSYCINTTSYVREFANQFLSKDILPKESENILLAKPQTFMNKSGIAVKLLTTYYKLPTTNLIVIHDELDLPLGKIKVRLGGAAAGHHGVESIIASLGTDKFIRVRLGIGNLRTQSAERKGQTLSAEKFVLEPFLHSEKSQVKHMIKQAIKVLDLLLEKGLEAAQTQFN